ncbi:hypothetical protein Tco_1249802 [Tanacetum coccineum]
MSSTLTNLLQNPISNRPSAPTTTTLPCTKPSSVHITTPNRRQLLFLMTTGTALTAMQGPSYAADIGLFGLRKKIEKVEEEAVEIVKEGFESAEKGVEAIERGEKEIESEVSFELGSGGGLVQAGVVAGAELVAVLVATSVVNGILGPEST